MLRNSEALSWFRQELRNHKALARSVLVLAVVGGVLGDALIPLFTSKMLERLANRAAPEAMILPMTAFILCTLVTTSLWPIRLYLRRKLEDRVRAGLSNRLDEAIQATPSLAAGNRGALVGATSKFFTAWTNVLYATAEQLVPFVVGMLSLIILMVVYAPFMILVALVAIFAAIMVTRKYGSSIVETWDNRTEASHEELAIFDGLFVSYRMQWLVRVLSTVRKHKSAGLTVSNHHYMKVMVAWQAYFQGMTNFLKIGAMVGSVVLATSEASWVGTAFLLVWYSLALSERLFAISGIAEAYGSSLVEAEAVLSAVRLSIPRRPLPCEQLHTVTVTDLDVSYKVVNDLGQQDEVVVQPPDMTFTEGVNLLRGPSGCGKSTVLGAMAGYVPYKGSILLNDHEVRDYDVRSPMVYGEQGFEKLGLSVRQLFGEDPDETLLQQCLAFAAYEDAPLRRALPQLSGGQRRRVFLAATFYWTLRAEADALLLDEPTNDLDDKSIDRLLEGIDLLVQQLPNLIIVLTSHEERMKSIASNIVEL